jgi:hypothetical protein
MVRLTVEKGLGIIAITDHDSTDGIVPALEAARNLPLKVIPGVEISTDVPHGEVHILGYFVDYHDVELQHTLKESRDSRRDRARGMVAKLGDLGINIKWERVRELAGSGSVGRPHIAQAILERGYISSIREAFDRYIGRDGPAYVERKKMTPPEAVRLIVRKHGLPVLAHPANIDGLEELLLQLKAEGLVGMEVYYNGYSTEVMGRLNALADKYELIPCGGSDYHGLGGDNETPPGGVDVPLQSAERLIAISITGRGQKP